MEEEMIYRLGAIGAVVREWAHAAFWIAATVMCLTAAYRFLFA